MGADLGTVYNALWNDAVWLHAKWNLYRQLYAHSPERVALLAKVAGHFFGVIQDAVFEDVLLNLARLNDRLVHRRIWKIQLVEDLIGALGPAEGHRVVVVLGEITVDCGLQVDDRAEHATFEPPAGEGREERLDRVQP
jgi:hypothetical protein